MGFKRDVELILNDIPKKRQTMLFSATISSAIEPLAKKHTHNPVEISVESHVDASKLKQVYYDISDSLKFSLFVHLLKNEKTNLVMVFCATRRNVDFVADNLNNLGIHAKAIHGGLNQNQRTRVLTEFNSKNEMNVLVCTDVAARGLDIKEVSHVYNYDLPKVSEDYIHRIGRTARAGKDGIAINVLCSRDYENFNNILRDEKIKIEEAVVPEFPRVQIIANSTKNKNSDSRRRDSGSRQRDSSRGRSDGHRRDSRERTDGRKSFGRTDNRGNRRSSGRNNQGRRMNFGRRR
jgi:ATP-dependent RNA helicase DeaD